MIISDRQYILGLLDKVEKSLRSYADGVGRTRNEFAQNGRSEDLTYLLNEILWALPNLGMQTVISCVMREMEYQSHRNLEKAEQRKSD